MSEQQFCASCGHPLSVANTPLVTVGVHPYHRICWVLREAPSVKASVMVN